MYFLDWDLPHGKEFLFSQALVASSESREAL